MYNTIQSYHSHPKNVRDLKEELEALAVVLRALSEMVEQKKNPPQKSLTALELPLFRCGNACKEFDEVIAKCSSRSGGSGTSFRDWAKLKDIGHSNSQPNAHHNFF